MLLGNKKNVSKSIRVPGNSPPQPYVTTHSFCAFDGIPTLATNTTPLRYLLLNTAQNPTKINNVGGDVSLLPLFELQATQLKTVLILVSTAPDFIVLGNRKAVARDHNSPDFERGDRKLVKVRELSKGNADRGCGLLVSKSVDCTDNNDCEVVVWGYFGNGSWLSSRSCGRSGGNGSDDGGDCGEMHGDDIVVKALKKGKSKLIVVMVWLVL